MQDYEKTGCESTKSCFERFASFLQSPFIASFQAVSHKRRGKYHTHDAFIPSVRGLRHKRRRNSEERSHAAVRAPTRCVNCCWLKQSHWVQCTRIARNVDIKCWKDEVIVVETHGYNNNCVVSDEWILKHATWPLAWISGSVPRRRE